MKALYITSTETFAGKTSLCVGLGHRFQQDGLRVGYMKPISMTARKVRGRLVDEDADFMCEVLGVCEPMDLVAPVALHPQHIEDILSGQEVESYVARVKDAFAVLSRDKDVVLMEGGAHCMEGAMVNLAAPQVIRLLEAKALVVVRYSDETVVDMALGARMLHGEAMLGVVINSVPRQRMPFVHEVVRPFLEWRGVPVFGILPRERLLMAISVGELAEVLNGEILCCPESTGELVEYLMVGAMSVDSALTYFRRKPNKAVITGGDRPDIQLAALETSTKCIILTGNLYPSPLILGRAEEVGVPMILVKHDTMSAVETIERFFGKTRLHQSKKVRRFLEMMEDRFEFEALYKALELETKGE